MKEDYFQMMKWRVVEEEEKEGNMKEIYYVQVKSPPVVI